jgi:hypothetical protein
VASLRGVTKLGITRSNLEQNRFRKATNFRWLPAVENSDSNRRGLALDLWYEADGAAPACQRIAIAPDVEWRDEPAWFFGMSGRADVPATPPLGMDAALGGTARVGTWLGALRLRADVGYGRKIAGSGASSELGLFGASADTLLAEMSRLGVRLGAGYWALPLWSSAQSDSPIWLHGPALSTGFAILPRKHPWSNFSARSDTWSVALEAAAYRWFNPAGDDTFAASVGLAADFGLP